MNEKETKLNKIRKELCDEVELKTDYYICHIHVKEKKHRKDNTRHKDRVATVEKEL